MRHTPSIPAAVQGAPSPREQNAWLAPILPALVSTAAMFACYLAAGPTLGVFIGGLFVAAFVTGPFVHAEASWLGRSLSVLGILHGIAGVWLYATIKIDLDLGVFCACYLTLATFILAIAGLTALLGRFGPLAPGVVTVAAVAWLTWPIWLSPALHGPAGERVVSWLVPAHPLFAANSVLRMRLGYWAEQGIAYHLTSLQDDIAYALPETVLACILLHAGIAAACLPPAMWRRRATDRLRPVAKDVPR